MVRRRAANPAQQARDLALHPAAARADELLKERERLLQEVNRKKQQLQQTRTTAERNATAALVKMAPLVERHTALVRELTELFDELLSEGRLSKRARNQVRMVRSALEFQGLLAPLENDQAEPTETDAWAADDAQAPWPEGANERAATGAPQARRNAGRASDVPLPEVESARQPGQERRSLRDIFRSLARAVHPDQARQEPDRAHRTEVMKQVTRAYQDGDLARLIELEQNWQRERAISGEGDPEARCGELERINRELLKQVRQLTREIRDIKREAREAAFGPLDQVVEQAQRELTDFASICAFVRKFRDGKSTLAEFSRGPVQLRGPDDAELARVMEHFFMSELDDDVPVAARRRGGKGAGR